MVELEDEAEGVAAVGGGMLEAGDGDPVDEDPPRVGALDRGNHVEQRALAASRGPGQGDRLSRRDPQRDVAQGADPAGVGLRDSLDLDRRTRRGGWAQRRRTLGVGGPAQRLTRTG